MSSLVRARSITPRLFLAGVAALVLAAWAMALWPVTVSAQSVETRIDRVETQLRALQRRVFTGEGPAPESMAAGPDTMQGEQAARLEVRLTTLERQIRTLNGEIEEMRYEINEANRRMETFMADAEFRFGALEGTGDNGARPVRAPGPGPSSQPAPTVPLEPQAALPPATGALPTGTVMEQYNHAYALLAQGRYEAAEAAFRAFMDRHPNDDLAGNAQYWLAQSFLVRGQNERAAQAFLEGYQAYPEGQKAPDYLLKIGMSLALIDQKEDACAVFQELASRHPNSPAARDRLGDERRKAGC